MGSENSKLPLPMRHVLMAVMSAWEAAVRADPLPFVTNIYRLSDTRPDIAGPLPYGVWVVEYNGDEILTPERIKRLRMPLAKRNLCDTFCALLEEPVQQMLRGELYRPFEALVNPWRTTTDQWFQRFSERT
jgi:hypothetical protein